MLEPLKTRIISENKKESIIRAPQRNGHCFGYWTCDTRENSFSYMAKSSDQTELYVVRGYFFPTEDTQWIAKSSFGLSSSLSKFLWKTRL